MAYPTPLETIEKKFFERGRDFKSYNTISIEDKKQIETEAQQFKDNYYKEKSRPKTEIKLYERVLMYLTTPPAIFKYKSFDEKVLFLISCIDPKLEVFNTYLKFDIPSIEDIKSLPSTQQIEAEKNRQSKINELKTTIASKIGINNLKLLKYESVIYRRYHRNFVVNVNGNFLKKLFEHAKEVNNFNEINDFDITRINMMTKYYLAKTDNDTTPNTLAFNILTQKSRLLLQSYCEEIAFFITVNDPEFQLLKIYEEESTIQNIKKRALAELGYFNQDLLRLEKQYHQKFYPDKKISSWSL